METLSLAIGVAAVVMLLGIAVNWVAKIIERRSLLMKYLDSCFPKEGECQDQTSSYRREKAGYWLK